MNATETICRAIWCAANGVLPMVPMHSAAKANNRAYAAYPLGTGLLRLNTTYLRELWRLGLPIGGTYAVEVGLFAFAALMTITGVALPMALVKPRRAMNVR